MTIVNHLLYDATGHALPNVPVEILLWAPSSNSNAYLTSGGAQVLGRRATRTNGSGLWSLDLYPQSAFTAGGTVYQVIHRPHGSPNQEAFFVVPDSGPVNLVDILSVAPADLPIAASLVTFDHTGSQLTSINVEDAILELDQRSERVFLSNQDATFVHLTQGSATAVLEPTSLGWLAADQREPVVPDGFPVSVCSIWCLLTAAGGTAGEAGQPITVQMFSWVALVGERFGAAFRAKVGLPLGHANITLGGVRETEIYHCVKHTGGGGVSIAFATTDGVLLGTGSEVLQPGDIFEVQMNLFLYSD